ncbi:TIGR03088 family PEP-CTERM/XrtA system glycosyltransferase [Lentisalinibacter salinarum]|uniref:TIGR03088 family PEP-CTERM/XrtA system glycosyltransferase n=1 Tax=Lentisalinibacter salinarum TaxID=2992239 RepID=UPI00386DFA39
MFRPTQIVHIIYRLDFGGMENGLVNLINGLPADRFRHAILCLTEATDFRQRIRSDNVEIIECRKPPGNHLPTYWRIFRELRRLRPDIVHTRNLGTLDLNWVALLAGCRHRIHGEHGWSPEDPRGLSRKNRLLRRLCNPAVGRYVAVSQDIARWLVDVIGIAASKVETIHNGVQIERFTPPDDCSGKAAEDTGNDGTLVFGTVGRQEPIKGLDVFLYALADLLEERAGYGQRIRVVMAGDGPDHQALRRLRNKLGLGMVELPGATTDVPKLLRELDFFVQPSLNEGISNTVLEAMASGLATIATNVGGNPELIRDGEEGQLIRPNDRRALRDALARYLEDRDLRQRQGRAARRRAESEFSLAAMIDNYQNLYAGIVGARRTVLA